MRVGREVCVPKNVIERCAAQTIGIRYWLRVSRPWSFACLVPAKSHRILPSSVHWRLTRRVTDDITAHATFTAAVVTRVEYLQLAFCHIYVNVILIEIVSSPPFRSLTPSATFAGHFKRSWLPRLLRVSDKLFWFFVCSQWRYSELGVMKIGEICK